MTLSNLSSLPFSPVQLPLFLTFPYGLPLVVSSLSFGKSQGHLRFAILEVNLKGYQRLPPFSDLSHKTFDLLLVQEKLPGTQGVMIAVSRKRIGAYVHVVKEQFAASGFGIAIFQISPSKAQGLHLRTQQDHARLILIKDEIVVPCFTILAYNLYVVLHKLPKLRSIHLPPRGKSGPVGKITPKIHHCNWLLILVIIVKGSFRQ